MCSRPAGGEGLWSEEPGQEAVAKGISSRKWRGGRRERHRSAHTQTELASMTVAWGTKALGSQGEGWGMQSRVCEYSNLDYLGIEQTLTKLLIIIQVKPWVSGAVLSKHFTGIL